MRIKHHYLTSKKTRLVSFLKKGQIKFNLIKLPETEEFLCEFDLYEDQEIFDKFKFLFLFIAIEDIKTIEYSKDDIKNAEWLCVYSKIRNIDWIFSSTAFSQTCQYKKIFIKEPFYKHIEQVGELSIGKVPKWKKRLFLVGQVLQMTLFFVLNLQKVY